MKFLFVLGQFSKMGGAERQAIILADQLKNHAGAHVDFLAWGGEGRIQKELISRGIKTWVFPLDWNVRPHTRALRLWQLSHFIKKDIQPDILLPYIGFNCKIIGLIWRRTGARYTWWNQRDEGREVYGSRLERHVINSVPDVVSNSYEGRDFLVKKFGIPTDGVTVINNGIEPPTSVSRSKWRDRLGLSDEDFLITMVANFTRYKDHETLIRAFAALQTSLPRKNLQLALAGRPGETLQNLKALAYDLNLSGNLHFVGEVEAIGDLYAASDLSVHSSVNEGCPNAVLEAMTHGLAVCGTDISGIRQALGVREGSQLLAKASDASALSTIIRKLIEDPAQRLALGRANQKRVAENFSPQKLAENVLSLIRANVNL